MADMMMPEDQEGTMAQCEKSVQDSSK